MPSSGRSVFFGEHVFYVFENVYEPAEDSFLFAEQLEVDKGSMVIDMGTGCGLLGIIAAKNASRVIAVDLNPHAVHCTITNIRVNHVGLKMDVVQGDLFNPIRSDAKFDTILFNAPYLPSDHSDETTWLRLAWAGGSTGRSTIDRFVCEAPKYLKPKGVLFLMQSTLSDVDKTIQKLKRKRLKVSVVAEQALPFFEAITLLKAEKLH